VTTTIIAGRVDDQVQADVIVEELLRAGFRRECVSSFFLNPPGQHDTYPIGGDHDRSAGAQETPKTVAEGAAAGAAIGLAATSLLGPLGLVTGGLLGAHVGVLIGGLAGMKERGDTGRHGEDAENAVPLRRSGIMIAVAIAGRSQEDKAKHLMQAAGAQDLELAQGTIAEGDWVDFDPISTPNLIAPDPRIGSSGPSAPSQR
jgi:hypothetical protein